MVSECPEGMLESCREVKSFRNGTNVHARQ